MSPISSRLGVALGPLVAGLVWLTANVSGQPGAKDPVAEGTRNGQWPSYTGDVRGSRYSPLDQINASNFNKLEIAWRFKTDNLGNAAGVQARRNAVDGQRRVVCDRRHATRGRRARCRRPASCCGCTANARAHAAPTRRASCRAAASPTGPTAKRNASCTSPRDIGSSRSMPRPACAVPAFGKDGVVDLKLDDAIRTIDLGDRRDRLHSTPVVASDVVIVGAAFREGGHAANAQEQQGLRPRLRRPHRASGSGSFTRFPCPASSATTPG